MKNCVQIATAVLGCSSVAIPLHRKKHVPTASSPDRIRPVEKEEKKGKKGKRQGVKGWPLLQPYPRTDASFFPVIRLVFPAYRGKQPVETNRVVFCTIFLFSEMMYLLSISDIGMHVLSVLCRIAPFCNLWTWINLYCNCWWLFLLYLFLIFHASRMFR